MPTSPDGAARLKGFALVGLAAVSWATGGVTAKWLFVRSTVGSDALALSATRAFFAFVLLAMYLAWRHPARLRVEPRRLPFLVAFGVAGTAMLHLAYYAAIEYTDVATAILLEYLAPVIVLVVAVVFLGERLTWVLPAGVALSVSGCALMVGVVGGDGLTVAPRGIAWGLAAAVFFATYILMGKYATGRIGPWTLLVYGLGSASVFWLVYPGAVSGALDLLSTGEGVALVVYVAVVGTLVPFGSFLSAVHHISATEASVAATLEPVLAGVISYVLLGEVLTVLQLLGGALVIAAVVLVQSKGRIPRVRLPFGT